MAGKPKYKDPKTEYVQTDVSLRKLAKQWKIPFGTISSRNKTQGWSELRAQFRNKVNTKIEEAAIGQEVDNATKIHDNTGRALLIASGTMLTCVEHISAASGGIFAFKPDSPESKKIKNIMSSISSAVATIGRINERTDDLYNLNTGESEGVTPEAIAALVSLATSQGPDSPPGRILPN